MKNILLRLLFFLLPALAIAQTAERIISGRLTESSGDPLPGVNIVVKGTTTGTTTDAGGYYRITAPLGATLVFSFVGFTAREVIVTEKNSLPANAGSIPATASQKGKDTQPTQKTEEKQQVPVHKPDVEPRETTGPAIPGATKPGVATLSDEGPGFVVPFRSGFQGLPGVGALPPAYSIRYITGRQARRRYGPVATNGVFVIDNRPGVPLPFGVSFTSAFTLDQINRLPALQNQYAQGSPQNGTDQWRGPDAGELFNWGPPVRNLEFDGLPYAFDHDGALTPRGSGNGIPARVYNPYTFFRNGFSTDHHLTLRTRFRKTEITAGYTRHAQQSVMPNAHTGRNQWQAQLKRMFWNSLEAEYALFYTRTDQRLPNRSGSWAHVLLAVMLTPPTFDNASGLSRGEATQNPVSYQLPDGTYRSFAMGEADNPYALVNVLPDQQQDRQLLTHLNLRYSLRRFTFLMKNSLETQRQSYVSGIPPGLVTNLPGRLTDRQYRTVVHQLAFVPSYNSYLGNNHNLHLDANLAYVYANRQDRLLRQDGTGFHPATAFAMSKAGSIYIRQASPGRCTHELTANVRLKYRDVLVLDLANQSYFSSTYATGTAWLPSAGAAFRFSELPFLRSSSLLTHGKLFANLSRNLREAPLVYNQWPYNTTLYNAANYRQYFESQEIVSPENTKPEQMQQWETGLETSFFNNSIQLSVSYFQHLTTEALVPIAVNGTFRLENRADIQNRGSEWSLTHYKTTGDWTLISQATFHQVRPVVKRLYGAENRLPLAGFADISSNLVAGQPYGVLIGSRWQRNENGQLIIGADGFPLVDQTPGVIGNPNPAWTAALENTIHWRNWSLRFMFDLRQGGDVWNGTQAALNYRGVSQTSQEQRSIRNYIFEGVLPNGQINGRAVDFANPAAGLAANRWVRYGMAGVGEESVQKSSWIRLNELKISYSLNRILSKRISGAQASVAFIGRNLWLWTPYTGVDPSATLFGYGSATGLDWFNAPSLRSYGLSLHITI